MKLAFVLSLFLAFTLPQFVSAADDKPKVPDPFCSPQDFFKYLDQGKKDRVLYVLEKCPNVDLNDIGPKKQSLIRTTIYQGWEDVFAKLLARSEIDFQKLQFDGDSSKTLSTFSLMFKSFRYDWIKRLIEARPEVDVNQPDNAAADLNLLHRIAKLKGAPMDLLEFLLAHPKIDVNQHYQGLTALQLALAEENILVVERLLKDTRVNRRGMQEILCKAATAPMKDLLLTLIDAGQIDPNSNCGNTSLFAHHIAMEQAQDYRVPRALLKNPRLSFAAPGRSITLLATLLYKTKNFPRDIFNSVLDHPTFQRGDVSTVDGNNAWHVLNSLIPGNLSEADQKEVFRRYADFNTVDINGLNKSNRTPLMAAVSALNQSGNGGNPVLQFLLSRPGIDVNFVSEIEGGKIKITALLLALWNSSRSYLPLELKEHGAKLDTAGDINAFWGEKNALMNAIRVATLEARPDLFQWVLTRKDLDLNLAPARYPDQTPIRLAFEELNKLRNDEDGRTATLAGVIGTLFADPRFDPTSIAKVGPVKPDRCSLLSIAVEKNLQAAYAPLLAHLPAEEQARACDPGVYSYEELNPLQLAAFLGRHAVVEMLLAKTSIPIRPNNSWGKPSISAYRRSIARGDYRTAMLFIDKGFLDELNFTQDPDDLRRSYFPVLYLAAKAKDYAAVEKLLKIKAIDPNLGEQYNPYDYYNALTVAADNNDEAMFTLLFNDPRTKLTQVLDHFGPWVDSDGKEGALMPYARRVLAKFELKDAADKLAYHRSVRQLMHRNWAAAELMALMKKKGFDYNHVLALQYDQKLELSLIGEAISAERPDLLRELLKIRGIDKFKGHPPVYVILFRGLNDYEEPVTEEMLRDYTASLEVGTPLPVVDGKDLFGMLESSREETQARVILRLLAVNKYKLTPANAAKVFELRYRIYESKFPTYVDRMLSHPSFAPTKQWSQLLLDTTQFREEKNYVAFLKKWASKLDMNVAKDGQTALTHLISRQYYWKDAFEALLVTKASVAGVLPNITHFRSEDNIGFFDRLLELRGKEIPLADFHKAIAQMSSSRGDLNQESERRMELMLGRIATVNGLSAAGYRQEEPFLWSLSWKDKSLSARILAEDKSLTDPRALQEILGAVMKSQRYDLFEGVVAKGANLELNVTGYSREGRTPLGLAMQLKDLRWAELLLAKGVRVDGDGGWQVALPYQVAISTDFLEGAEWLRTHGAKLQEYSRSIMSEIFRDVVKRNALPTMQYLISQGFDGGYGLVEAVVAQNDAMLKILGGAPRLSPNFQSYDPKDPRRLTNALIEAARYGRKDYIVALLSIPGIDKNAKDSLKYRAIDWAATNGFYEIVELLK